MNKRDVIIKFVNGQDLIIKNVENYEINNDFNVFFVIKNDERIMLPRENVSLIGWCDEVLL